MKKKWLMAAALPLVAAGVAVLTPLHAADHVDGLPTDDVLKDPAADITDVYAFTAPGKTGRLVLIMNVGPLGTISKFSDKVEYSFRLREYTGDPTMGEVKVSTTANDITCTFAAGDGGGQTVNCTGPGGLSATADVNPTSTTCTDEDMCVYAGQRSDPFFFDLAAFQATLASDAGSQFCKLPDGGATETGTNFFDKKNVLSIVVEFNVAKAFGLTGGDAGGDAGDAGASDAGPVQLPILAVAAETKRTGN